MPISQPSGNQAVHRPGGVVKLLVSRVPVARLHFRHQPAVVPYLGQRGADGGPVVVTQKQIRVYTLVATAPAFLHHVFQVNSSDAWSVDLNPLFCKPRVVDVADVEVDPHGGAVHVVQELPKLPRADEKPMLGVAVLASNPDTGAGGLLGQRPEGLYAALVHLVVGDFLGHQAGDQQDRVGAEQHRGLDLPLHDAHRPAPDGGVARGEGRGPVQSGGDVGYDETGVFDLAPQLPHLNVRGGQLKPRHVAQPELDAVETGLLDELQTLLESPLLATLVIGDGFLHKRASYSK